MHTTEAQVIMKPSDRIISLLYYHFFQSCQLWSLVEELEMLIDENLPTSTLAVSASCQTAAQLDQPEGTWKLELERKNSEVERLLMKSKEAEVDLLRKEMIIEGISEKVETSKYYQYCHICLQ